LSTTIVAEADRLRANTRGIDEVAGGVETRRRMASRVGQAVSWRRIAVRALLAGLALLVLLVPWGGGIDPNPPTCYGIFGPLWTVPCDGWPPIVAAALMSGAVLLVSVVARHRMVFPTRIALAALGGLTMFVLQLPRIVLGSDEPTCVGWFGNWTVPCGGWPTVAMGVVTSMIVLLAVSLDELRS
jgi:hypothetical protein